MDNDRMGEGTLVFLQTKQTDKEAKGAAVDSACTCVAPHDQDYMPTRSLMRILFSSRMNISTQDQRLLPANLS
jgi:hypothetical protein